jgi:TonB family protein
MEGFVNQRQSQHLAGLSFVGLLHVLLIYAFFNGLASNRTVHAPLPPLLVRLVAPEKPQIKELPPLKPNLQDAPQLDILKPPVLDPLQPPDLPKGPPVVIEGPPQVPSLTADNGRLIETAGTGTRTGAKSVQSDCSNAASLASSITYPARAKRLGLQQGQVNVEFSVAAGGAVEIDGVTESNSVFESAAVDAVKNLHCSAGRYRLPVSFVLQE